MSNANGNDLAVVDAPVAAQIQKRPPTLSGLLESRKEAMAMVLPKHLTPERLIKIALVAVSKSDRLMDCTHESILQSVMIAAQLGLDCGGVLGSAYLVPFKRNKKNAKGQWESWYECQLIIGYRGMIDLARRSGQISTIEARVVWENDTFEIEYGMEMHLKHVPCLDQDPGNLRLVYAVAHLKDGGTQFELMTRAQIDAIRSRSKAKDDGPWVSDYPEMARKTIVKRLFKYLPVSIEMAEAVEHDANSDFGADFPVTGQLMNTPLRQLNSRLTTDAPADSQPSSPPPPAEGSADQTQGTAPGSADVGDLSEVEGRSDREPEAPEVEKSAPIQALPDPCSHEQIVNLIALATGLSMEEAAKGLKLTSAKAWHQLSRPGQEKWWREFMAGENKTLNPAAK